MGQKKELILILMAAGPNGAGKSSSIAKMLSDHNMSDDDFIDTDKRAMARNNGEYSKEIVSEERKKVDELKENLISEGKKSFGFETVLGSQRHLNFITRAQMMGYTVKLLYVGLDSKLRAINRVAFRAATTGQGVDSDTVAALYKKSKENYTKAAHLADYTFFYDNSTEYDPLKKTEPVYCFSTKKTGEITDENPGMPDYAKLVRDVVKDPSLGLEYLHQLDDELDRKVIEETLGDMDSDSMEI